MPRRARTLLAATLAVAFVASGATTVVGQEVTQSPEEEVVHSWALVPAGSTEVTGAGNRPTFSYDLPPGGQVDDALTVINYSNVPLTFDLYPTDAFNTPTGAFDLLPAAEDPVDVGTWITLPQRSLTVPGGQQATMPFTLSVPQDATPGDHVGAILAASTARGAGADGRVVDLDRRTGSRVYLRVDGELTPDLAVENVETSYKPTLNPMGGSAEVTYRIRNRGNVRLGAEHSVSVAGAFGLGRKRADTQEIVELLPGEELEFTVELDGVPATVLGTTKVHLASSDVEASDVTYDPISRSSWFLALPVTVVVLLIAAGLISYARRQYRRRQRATGFGPTPRPT
jgi:hypothetical protein